MHGEAVKLIYEGSCLQRDHSIVNMVNEHDIELLESYLEGKLQGKELEAFLERQKSDPEFAQFIHVRQMIGDAWTSGAEYLDAKKWVTEAMKRGGVAGEIAFRLQEDAPDMVAALKMPIQRLAAMNLPLSARPDWNLTPNADSIVTKVKEMVGV